jgi:hypothetical protein
MLRRVPHLLVLVVVDELTTWVRHPPSAAAERVGSHDVCNSWVEFGLCNAGPPEASDGFTALRNLAEFIEEKHKQNQKQESSEILLSHPSAAADGGCGTLFLEVLSKKLDVL